MHMKLYTNFTLGSPHSFCQVWNFENFTPRFFFLLFGSLQNKSKQASSLTAFIAIVVLKFCWLIMHKRALYNASILVDSDCRFTGNLRGSLTGTVLQTKENKDSSNSVFSFTHCILPETIGEQSILWTVYKFQPLREQSELSFLSWTSFPLNTKAPFCQITSYSFLKIRDVF